MKINLKTMEADGSPEEIKALMDLINEPRKCPEPNLTVEINPATQKFAWRPPRETRKRTRVNWQVADDLKAAGLNNTQIAQRLGCSAGTVSNHYAKEKAEE